MPIHHEQFRTCWVLTGPTGSGKSEFALALAECYNAEIVGMDSMTLYRGMDIGTAKPTQFDRQRVPHHLIDVLEPWESATVAWWLRQAEATCRDIESRNKRVLFVGGTPLYLKALLFGLFDGPAGDPELRKRLEEEAQRHGVEALHRRLAAVDAPTASRLHPNDIRRVVRALEVWELTGEPLSNQQLQWSAQTAPSNQPVCWCMERPREELYCRINNRVKKMLHAGWLDEARHLRELPRPLSKQARKALGYVELFDYLDGKVDLPATAELIQTRSRQFAKRQLTWFRHLPNCRPIKITGDNYPDPTNLVIASNSS
jgi:tRNA dimethylallyltransferase